MILGLGDVVFYYPSLLTVQKNSFKNVIKVPAIFFNEVRFQTFQFTNVYVTWAYKLLEM